MYADAESSWCVTKWIVFMCIYTSRLVLFHSNTWSIQQHFCCSSYFLASCKHRGSKVLRIIHQIALNTVFRGSINSLVVIFETFQIFSSDGINLDFVKMIEIIIKLSTEKTAFDKLKHTVYSTAFIVFIKNLSQDECKMHTYRGVWVNDWFVCMCVCCTLHLFLQSSG